MNARPARSCFVCAVAPLALLQFSLAPRAGHADTKVNIYCDGDLDICKMTSDLLQIRQAAAQGVPLENATRFYAPWAWHDGRLQCLMGTTTIAQPFLDVCAADGLTVVDTAEYLDAHSVAVECTDFSGLDAIAHRSEVRGMTTPVWGETQTSAAPLPPSVLLRRASVSVSPHGTARLGAEISMPAPADASQTVAVALRVGNFDVITSDLVAVQPRHAGSPPARWVFHSGGTGSRVAALLNFGTGSLRLRVTGMDTSSLKDVGPQSVPVRLTVGTVERHYVLSFRAVGSAWRFTAPQ